MKKNIGTADRVLRGLIGIACFIASAIVGITVIKIVLVLVGLFSIFQAAVGWCALYALLGKNTCPIK